MPVLPEIFDGFRVVTESRKMYDVQVAITSFVAGKWSGGFFFFFLKKKNKMQWRRQAGQCQQHERTFTRVERFLLPVLRQTSRRRNSDEGRGRRVREPVSHEDSRPNDCCLKRLPGMQNTSGKRSPCYRKRDALQRVRCFIFIYFL